MTIVDLSAEAYHQDAIGDTPTLSASIAKILISSSPRHAWTQHPRLNPAYERDTDDKFSLGICAHALLLEGESRIAMVMADDWRTKLAREQRDEAYANGRIPLLMKDAGRVLAMVDAARVQLGEHEARPIPFTTGAPERTIVWEDSGVTCRARLDWLHDDGVTVSDYKTTSRSADPAAWVRSSLFGMGFDVQAAFYLRGLKAVTGRDGEFRFVVQETSSPYALSVVTPGQDVLALANEKVTYAIDLWRGCLLNDDWPAYSKHLATAELPAWEESRWLEKHGLAEREAA